MVTPRQNRRIINKAYNIKMAEIQKEEENGTESADEPVQPTSEDETTA